MRGKKRHKKSKQDYTVTIVLLTAITQLINALIELIKKLIE